MYVKTLDVHTLIVLVLNVLVLKYNEVTRRVYRMSPAFRSLSRSITTILASIRRNA